jgi:hypothetical protein
LLADGGHSVLEESSFGIVNAVRAASMAQGESLLLVVDQFEELMRFRSESCDRDGGGEAALFVSQLLRAADDFGSSIYVVLTMRSDFLGDCAQFPGLPEALNKGQYLIPRMTREQRRAAITDALAFFDVTMSERLTQRLLNDAGEDPDQLPVLQHALQQTFAAWKKAGAVGEIDFEHYVTAGTMERALHEHAESVCPATDQFRWLAARIFRCLTVNEKGRAVRRPAKLERILRVIGAAGDAALEQRATEMIRLFGSPENSFLVWAPRNELAPETVIDISHESLIRKWKTLQQWVEDEAKSVDVYRYLRRDAMLYPKDASLWGDPELKGALQMRDADGWNAAWAEQYSADPGASFTEVRKFLDLSVVERDRRARRDRWFTGLKWAAPCLVLALIIGGLWAYHVYLDKQAAQLESDQAQKQLIQTQQGLAEMEKDRANGQKELNALTAQIREKEKAVGENPALLAELDRLRKEQELANDSLKERARLINETKQQTAQTSQSYSDSLKRINELQDRLTQAWQERDEALKKAAAAPVGASAKDTDEWRRRATAAEAEVSKLMAAQATVLADARAPFYPLIVPQSSWNLYPSKEPVVGILVEDLKRLPSATARMFVYPYSASSAAKLPKFLAALPPGRQVPEAEAKAAFDQLARNRPCPSKPQPDGVQCFMIHKRRVLGETELAGTIDIGSIHYAVHVMAWTQNAIGGQDVLALALAPIR